MLQTITDPQNLAYIKAAESYSLLKPITGQVQIKSKPMKYFSQKLLQHGWCHIHKSYMVNPLFVKAVTIDHIEIINGELLPLSRRKRKSVFQWLKAHN